MASYLSYYEGLSSRIKKEDNNLIRIAEAIFNHDASLGEMLEEYRKSVSLSSPPRLLHIQDPGLESSCLAAVKPVNGGG